LLRGDKLETGVDLNELQEFIRSLIIEKKEFIKDNPNAVKGLMGLVMSRYRGKVSGKEVLKLIEKNIKAIK